MTEGFSRGRPLDEFEMHARTWRAGYRIADGAAGLCRLLGLDPELAERVREAAVEDVDHRGTIEALEALALCFATRVEDNPPVAAALRAAIKREPALGDAIARLFATLIQAEANLEALEEDLEEDEEDDED